MVAVLPFACACRPRPATGAGPLRLGTSSAVTSQGPRGRRVAALALVPGAAALDLEFAFGDVVDHAVTGHVGHGVGLGNVAPAFGR